VLFGFDVFPDLFPCFNELVGCRSSGASFPSTPALSRLHRLPIFGASSRRWWTRFSRATWTWKFTGCAAHVSCQ